MNVAPDVGSSLVFRRLRGRPGFVRGRLRFSFSLGFRRSVVPSFRRSRHEPLRTKDLSAASMITRRITTLALLALASTTASAQTPASLAAQSQQLASGPRNVDPASLRFQVAVPPTVHAAPITGRVYVIV